MNDEHVPTNGEETKTDCLRKGQRLRQLRVERFLDAVYVSSNALGYRRENEMIRCINNQSYVRVMGPW